MQRLTGMDASFLYLETATNHMHVAATAIFDPSTVPGGYSFEKVRDLVDSRLHLLPPFRRRLLTIPFELHHPLWIEDPDFDLEYHVRRAALPAPGGEAELAEFAEQVMARPLDRDRPLWEMYVVEGLEHGHIATITKTHHAAIDGVSGAELTVNLLDLSADAPPTPPPDVPWKPDRIPSDLELFTYALNSLSRSPVRGYKAARRTVATALNLRRRNRSADVHAPPAPFSAPRTPLNVAISPHRRFAFTEVALDDVKMVKNALGGTVNDVVLAMCSGALRSYLDGKGVHPDRPLLAMIPISVRTDEEKGAMGNRVSSMFVSLASNIDDPVKRLHAITDGTRNAKEQEKAIDAGTLASDWVEFAAPALAARAARLMSRMQAGGRIGPMSNVTVSNVPGPSFPLYSAGARMVAMYPMGPIIDGSALNITVMSYMGSMYFGLMACRESVPDVWDIARGINAALDELKKASDGTTAPKPRKPRSTAKAVKPG